MTPLMAAAKVIDDYAGYAADGEPLGSIAVPRWMLVNLRAALKKALAERAEVKA